MSEPIGGCRVRIVLALGQDQAVVSWLTARRRVAGQRRRLRFVGTVQPKPRVLEHLHEVVLPVVEQIARPLGVKPAGFDLSVANIGAASAAGLDLEFDGFSADLPVFLALLGASLQLTVAQDALATGAIGSTAGELRPVAAMEAKLQAAKAATVTPAIRTWVCADPDVDGSLFNLAPAQRQRLVDALAAAQQHLDVYCVSDVGQVLQLLVCEDAILLSCLRCGYFDLAATAHEVPSPLATALAHLTADNPARFWNGLQAHLLAGRLAPARALVKAYIQHFLRRREFPAALGTRLPPLVVAVPPILRNRLFPLAPFDLCARLSQYADISQQRIAKLFLDAICGSFAASKPARTASAPRPEAGAAGVVETKAASLVNLILTRLDPVAMTREVRQPIDDARARFILPRVIVGSDEEFFETIYAFYLTLLQHTCSAPVGADPRSVADVATALMERAFADEGGTKGALAEARAGVRGGMRYVLDAMTAQHCAERQRDHVRWILIETLGPLNFQQRVECVSDLLRRSGLADPGQDDLAQRAAKNLEELVQLFLGSLEKFLRRLRSL